MDWTTSIYVVAESNDGPVKIGVSNNPGARCVELQQGNSRKLRMVYSREITQRRKAFEIERSLHRQLNMHRLEGEWFDLCIDDVVIYIEGHVNALSIKSAA